MEDVGQYNLATEQINNSDYFILIGSQTGCQYLVPVLNCQHLEHSEERQQERVKGLSIAFVFPIGFIQHSFVNLDT